MRKKSAVIATICAILILAAFVSSLFLGFQVYSTKIRINPSSQTAYEYHPAPLNSPAIWNTIIFNNPSNSSIARFNFFGKTNTANGTAQYLFFGVKLSHASGTALRSLTLNIKPASVCCYTFFLAPAGMSFSIDNYPQFQINTINKTNNVQFEIDNFGPIGMTQFAFGFGLKLIPTSNMGNNNGSLSMLMSASLGLYSTSSIATGNHVLYNGSSIFTGRTYEGNTTILVTS